MTRGHLLAPGGAYQANHTADNTVISLILVYTYTNNTTASYLFKPIHIQKLILLGWHYKGEALYPLISSLEKNPKAERHTLGRDTPWIFGHDNEMTKTAACLYSIDLSHADGLQERQPCNNWSNALGEREDWMGLVRGSHQPLRSRLSIRKIIIHSNSTAKHDPIWASGEEDRDANEGRKFLGWKYKTVTWENLLKYDENGKTWPSLTEWVGILIRHPAHTPGCRNWRRRQGKWSSFYTTDQQALESMFFIN